MENYDFCEELKVVYADNIFDREVIRYYINGFADALCMDLSCGTFKSHGVGKKKNLRDKHLYFTDEILKKKNDDCLIKFSKNNYKNKKWFQLAGNYNNIEFSYDIYNITNRKVADDMANLPIEFLIRYKDNNKLYLMTMVTGLSHLLITMEDIEMGNSAFLVLKRTDLEIILRIIMRFLENPAFIISKYSDVINAYHSSRVSLYMDPGFTDNDIIIDKSGKILKKVKNR